MALGSPLFFLLPSPVLLPFPAIQDRLAAATIAAGLSADDVGRVIAQAASEAQASGLRAWIAVTDGEGNLLGLFRMDGARSDSRVPGASGRGLEGLALPAELAAVSKAATGAFLSSGGNAFSTRTASFIVQEHFPPRVDLTPGGPLFGVQFSSLVCTDFRSRSVLGLSADPGGFPLYRDGLVVGGVGVEGDGTYGLDADPADFDEPPEERAALAGTRGFEVPETIRADRILADGIRLPYVNVEARGGAGAALPAGEFAPLLPGLSRAVPSAAPASALVSSSLGGVRGQSYPGLAIQGSADGLLSAVEVQRVLEQAARQSVVTRAAIRQPLGSHARVSIAVVDVEGRILGFFRNEDAPNFGIDVSVQKARTAAFFSDPRAGAELRRANLSRFAAEVPLDGSVAFTSRAIGFLAQPLFPPGIAGTDPGPFSERLGEWSIFNTGLQLELVENVLREILSSRRVTLPCNALISRLPNGITVFPGGVPLYKSGRLVGAIGISGDGVDQDDLIAAAGSAGFEAPAERRCDRLVIRGVRLPYVKFPRHPNL